MKPDPAASPLAADDPRLSEWIDGRLPAAEAAEIARAVAASPELSRLVADLRGIKKSLASLPPSPPPAAFVGDVMAALDATTVGGAEDADVEAEWRKIERERLEEEIAEAREDAAAPVDEPMRHRWPWLALAAALAAGVLVAVVINRPPLPGEREVALAEGRADSGAERRGQKQDTAENNDLWLEHAKAHEKTSLPAAAAAPDPATQEPSDRVTGLRARAIFGSPADAAGDAAVRVVRYRVRTTADRARLDDLVAASNNRTRRQKDLPGEGDLDGAIPATRIEKLQTRAALAEQGASPESSLDKPGGKAGPVRERIEVSGSAAEIAAIVATLEAGVEVRSLDWLAAKSSTELLKGPGRGDSRKQLAASGPGAPAPFANDGSPEAEQSGAAIEGHPAVVRLIIEVIDESGAEAEAAEGGP